ncbi:MAG: ATP-binding protein [Chromatiales bacterium]|jgi:two-component system sensor histidine kinase FlrB
MSQALAPQSIQLESAHDYHFFSQLTAQLAEDNESLRQQVERLSQQLSEARLRHFHELKDKERLANRLSLVLEALPAAVVVVDEKDRIDQFNPITENLFPGIRWGRRWSEVFSEAVSKQIGNHEWQLEDGRCVSVSEQSLMPEPGKILVVLDVTDSRALQEQLNRQERLTEMGQMAAHLAHQIRTPVSSALLYSDHLARNDLSADQRSRFSRRLKDSLKHTESQVSDLLCFARGAHFAPENINLSNLLGDLEDSLEAMIRTAQANLRLHDRTDGKAYVTGNTEALAGAFANLIENAARHGGEQVDIDVYLTPVDDGYCIRVEDNGSGIPAAIRDKVFDPFFTTSSDGTGLGLAVVQNVVLAHGGAIRLIEAASGGAGFIICLPDLTQEQYSNELSGEVK